MVDEEAIQTSRSPKRTACCFGESKLFYLLTLIQGSTILYGTQSVGQLVTRLGLCSCSCLPVRAETASTCWVFAVTSIVLVPILMFESIISKTSILQERSTVIQRVSQIRVQKKNFITLFYIHILYCI